MLIKRVYRCFLNGKIIVAVERHVSVFKCGHEDVKPVCAAPAQSPGNAAPVCPQAIEWPHTSLGKAAWQRLVVAEEIEFIRSCSGNTGLLPWDG